MPNLVEIGPAVLDKKILNFVNLYFCYFIIISPWKRIGPFICTNLNPHHPRRHCAKCGSGEIFFEFRQFLHFLNYLPLEIGWGPLFEQTWIPIKQGCIVLSLVEIGPVVLDKKIFFNFLNVFSHFRNYLPLEKGGAIIWRNLNPLHPKMHCAKFGWNWPSGSEEEEIFNFVNVFSLFRNLEKSGALIWTNLNPLYQRMLFAKFGWNWSSGSGEEDEYVKSLQ